MVIVTTLINITVCLFNFHYSNLNVKPSVLFDNYQMIQLKLLVMWTRCIFDSMWYIVMQGCRVIGIMHTFHVILSISLCNFNQAMYCLLTLVSFTHSHTHSFCLSLSSPTSILIYPSLFLCFPLPFPPPPLQTHTVQGSH